MKREAVGSTKMKKLCKLLGVKVYVAIGIMESIWHLTAREAPAGDIGKLTNEDIALSLDYEGDPDALVDALVDAHWLDRSEIHRLIIHDWHQHSDDAVDMRLARAITLYANGTQPRMTRLSVAEKALLCARYAQVVRTVSAPPVPVPVPVPEPVIKTTPKAPPSAIDLPDWLPRDAWDAFVEMRKKERHPLTETAVKLAIGKLEKLRTAGQDVRTVLEESTFNGYRGLWPAPATNANGSKAPPKPKTQYERDREAQQEERRKAIQEAGVR